MKRILGLLLCLPAISPAYYHFIRYDSRFGFASPIVQKFDVNALPDKTLQYFISEQGPTTLAAGDSMAAVTSQIRAAARVWNDVPTSDLRLAFGGFAPRNTQMATASVEVIFDEIPPGLIAMGGPTTLAPDAITTATGGFTPIIKSLVVFNRDLSRRPSFSEGFFLTAVHELGHALGLQHSWASGVMSTEITRGTTKALPLASDDVAGISTLYPSATFAQSLGSISGRVTLGGNGIGLASVVAVSPTGPVVSALSHPDGTYRIDGVPPGEYYLYAHPVPPGLSGEPQPVNLVLPTEGDRSLLPGPAFDLQFWPQGRSPVTTLTVRPGLPSASIDFAVQARPRVTMHSAQTYSFYTTEAVKPAHVVLGSQNVPVIFYGFGLSNGQGPLPGLTVSTVGSPESFPNGVSYYSGVDANSSYLRADITPHVFSVEGPKHLLFTVNGESYVLPSAVRTVSRRAPSITGLVQNPDRTVTVSGSNLGATTRVAFDGMVSVVRSTSDGQLIVQPPPAAPGHRAIVVALNSDGQSSLFTQGATSPTYTYDSGETAQITVSPSALPSGVETVVEITGSGTNFAEDLSRLGFGTSDVSVRRLWSVNRGRLLAHVSVAPNAAFNSTTVTATAGLQVATAPFAFQVFPSSGREMYVPLSTLGPTNFLSGSSATLPVAHLPAQANVTMTIADRSAMVTGVSGGQVAFIIPSGMPAGPAVVRMNVNGETAFPAIIRIDPPPAILLAVQTINNLPITSQNPARPGDFVQLLVGGLTEAGFTGNLAQLKAASGSLEHNLLQVIPFGSQHLVQVLLNVQSPTSEPLALTLAIDGRASAPISVPIR